MKHLVKTANSTYIIDDSRKELTRIGDRSWKFTYERLVPVMKGMPLIAISEGGRVLKTSPVEEIGLAAI